MLYPFNYQGAWFSDAKIRSFYGTAKLMGDFLLEGIELGLAAVAIAEQSYTDALPIA